MYNQTMESYTQTHHNKSKTRQNASVLNIYLYIYFALCNTNSIFSKANLHAHM